MGRPGGETWVFAVLAFRVQCVEQFHQRNLGAVQLPVAGENPAVFVAVGVAEHDVLLAVAVGVSALHHGAHAGQGVVVAHDGRGVAQVFNGFKQRHHDQVAGGVFLQQAVHQAGFFLQQQHLQQVADCFGVADDGVANGVRAKALAPAAGVVKNRQFVLCVCRIGCARHAQWPGIVELLQQHGALAHLVQRAVVQLHA